MTSQLQQQDRWPFIVIRHDTGVNDAPDVFARLMECHARHPGACDEFWFATGSRKTVPELEREIESFARYRSLCEKAGILLGYQQGLTLGHGEAHDGKARSGEQAFPDDAWQRGADGARIGFLCPRSPFVLDYEREYAKTVMRVAQPSSYWIDDDLRLGVSKPDGCFCDRCLAAFNAANGLDLSRDELARRLYDTAVVQDPVRGLWCAFNAESLALYASAVRQAADELGSPCRLGYQAVSANRIYTALDYRPLLEALSGSGRAPVGIRPGHGFYTEAEPRGMVAKCLAVAREAERCRDFIRAAAEGDDLKPAGRFHAAEGGNLVASVCYEEENYPRRVLHKSPGAIMTECALALASGCDSLSLYWYSALQREPVEEYDRFLAALLRARPYFERLAASTRRTRLGGLARFVGAAAAQTADYDLYDPIDFDLACAGIPVTVAGPAASAWYLTEKSRRELPPASGTVGTLPPAIVDVADIGQYPTAPRRRKLLDDLDAATVGAFPVRIDECRPLRILPRIREDGSLDSVTLLNLSIGDTDAFSVRVRRPGGGGGVLRDPRDREEPFALAPGATVEEGVARIENLPGWGVATLFFDESVLRPSPRP